MLGITSVLQVFHYTFVSLPLEQGLTVAWIATLQLFLLGRLEAGRDPKHSDSRHRLHL